MREEKRQKKSREGRNVVAKENKVATDSNILNDLVIEESEEWLKVFTKSEFKELTESQMRMAHDATNAIQPYPQNSNIPQHQPGGLMRQNNDVIGRSSLDLYKEIEERSAKLVQKADDQSWMLGSSKKSLKIAKQKLSSSACRQQIVAQLPKIKRSRSFNKWRMK